MQITRLEVVGFRNLKPLALTPAPGVNVIYGRNAQGKTNLVEAIWMCAGLKSFRGAKDAELVGFGEPGAQVKLSYRDSRRENAVQVKIAQRRSCFLNGVALPSPAGLIGSFRAVVFSPAFLSIVQSGPEHRRRFLDAAMCQMKPACSLWLAEYNRLLRQRNSLLKDISMEPALLDMLDVIDEKMAAAAEEITRCRLEYLDAFAPLARGIYSGLSGGREEIGFSYLQKDKEKGASCAEIFKANRRADILNKTTCAGPHRDDIGVTVNGVSARDFGSQGQQRSVSLAMKLAEASVIRAETGEEPVTLLDDVMSELDAGRQDYILNHIDKRQVFITCCDPTAVLRLTDGNRIFVDGGKITEEG